MIRRLIRGGAAPAHAGKPVAIDGLTAVTLMEVRMCDAAALGATYPASLAARAWREHESRRILNAFGTPLSSIDADSARSAMASAIGLSLSGRRAAVFCSGPDLLECRDLVSQAAHRHAPLVIHAVLRAGAQQGAALGSGHEGLHALSDLPCAVFVAANVQEAVDATLLARRCAELALLPAIVAMDSEQTALAVQTCALPDDELIRSFVGRSADVLPPPTQAQRVPFGTARRRLPRLYDADQPAMLGALADPLSFATGSAARRVFFEAELARLIDESVAVLAAQTGRDLAPLRAHRAAGAKIVLLAQGSLVEHAIAAAEAVGPRRVGVVGLGRLQPLDVGVLADLVGQADILGVLERSEVAPGQDGPLTRLVRAGLDRARENAQHGTTHTGVPPLKKLPKVVTVVAGLGGLPVRGRDLEALIEQLSLTKRSVFYLGLDFARSHSAYPKHQVLLDTLRREFPALGGLGVCGAAEARRVDHVTGVALVGRADGPGRDLPGLLASFVHGLVGGGLRARCSASWQRGVDPVEDLVLFGPADMVDPGDDVAIDVVVLSEGAARAWRALRSRVASDCDLLAPLDVANTLTDIPAGVRVHAIDCSGASTGVERAEMLLGAAARLTMARLGPTLPSSSIVAGKREALLDGGAQAEREACVRAFAAGFENVRALPENAAAAIGTAAPAPPSALLALSRSEIGAGSITRFWNHTGAFYRSGEEHERVPEPGAALGVLPPLSALFARGGTGAGLLPVFDPATCGGSSDLWTTCPDGSIAALAITPRELLEAGIDLATRAGEQADALRPLVSQLVRRVAKLATGENPPLTAGEYLRAAFAEVSAKSDAPEDRRVAQSSAMEAVARQIGALPLAVTEGLFKAADRASPGSGAFLCVVVNPDMCHSAELVLSRCNGRGLRTVDRTSENVEAARRLWRLWEQLPDTSGAVIERARELPGIGALGAMMLSRHCLHAMVGTGAGEAGSGARLALRRVLAVAEYHAQPRLQRLLAKIEELQGKLSERIQSLLAKALPAADLDALAAGLESLGRSEVELGELSKRVDSAVVDGHVDGALLAGLVEVARGLADLHFRIRRGSVGLGRARIGLTIAGGSVAQWAGAFPDNPFAAPVIIDACDEAGGLARGAIEGALADVVEAARLMRLARVQLDRPGEAPHAAVRLGSLTFSDLTLEERELAPAMIVVGDAETLAGRGLSQVMWLLEGDLPVKVLVLNGAGGPGDGALSLDALGAYPPARRTDLALLAMLGRKAVVAQTSIAHPDHFVSSVERALGCPGPALMHVYAPSPRKHGFDQAATFEQARLAVQSRAWPIFTFDPFSPGVFGSCIDLSGNPAPGEAWSRDEASRPLTPLDWAASQARFADQFSTLDAGAASPTPVHEYLLLDSSARTGRTPFVERPTASGPVRLVPSPVLIRDAEDRLRLWRTLEELGGVVTPFTRQARAEAEQAVAAEHAAEIDRLRRDYEQKLATMRSQYASEVTATVASRLMQLAGYGSGN